MPSEEVANCSKTRLPFTPGFPMKGQQVWEKSADGAGDEIGLPSAVHFGRADKRQVVFQLVAAPAHPASRRERNASAWAVLCWEPVGWSHIGSARNLEPTMAVPTQTGPRRQIYRIGTSVE